MREGALTESKIMADGRETVVYPLTFGRARLCVCEPGSQWIDDGW